MASKEWLMTKIVTGALGLVTLISVCIGGANVLFDVKRDVLRVDDNQSVHEQRDEKQWDKAWDSIDDNTKAIHALQLQATRTETNQKEILRRLDEIISRFDKEQG